VRQPWASLISSGHKGIELRSRATQYRGAVVIVSGVNLWRGQHSHPVGPTGVTICTVELVDCRPVRSSDAASACLEPPAEYEWAWVLENPMPIKPVPFSGKLGLWRPNGHEMELITRALPSLLADQRTRTQHTACPGL